MGTKTPDAPIQDAIKSARKSRWKDPKRYLWLLSPALPLIGLGALTAYAIAPKKLRVLAWTGPIVIHGVIPVLDKIVGQDSSNPPDTAMEDLESDWYYKAIVKAYIPTQYAVTLLGAYLAGRRKDMPLSDYVGLTLSVGAVNGIAINTGHELSHKHDRVNRLASMMALAPTAYTHFAIEHPYGHHKRVATPEDPASSRMGESFWKFLPRTVIGSFKSAIGIEKERLARRGKGFWTLENELLQGWAMSGAFFGAATVVGGRRAIPFLAGQAAYGASLLEVINYIEHYGLKRELLPNGKYERTQPSHSWNSNYVMTNLFLYQLQRHSDHHAYPTRSFQTLRHFDNTPQLPAGYATMLLPAYIPSLWFDLMDKRVVEHYQGDLSKINMDPDRREELIATWNKALGKDTAEPVAIAEDASEAA